MEGDAKERLQRAAHAISTAVLLVRMEMPTLEAFLEECRKMDSFGSIIEINPALQFVRLAYSARNPLA